MKYGVDFRRVLGMLFGSGVAMVLGLFWMICWCQNHEQKEKGRFVEMLVLLQEYQCFRRLWTSFGIPEREVNKDEFQSRFKLRFVMVLAAFWKTFSTPQSLKHRCGCRVLVWRVLGGGFGKFRGFRHQFDTQGVKRNGSKSL